MGRGPAGGDYIFFFFRHVFQPLRYVFRFFLSSVAGIFFHPAPVSYPGIQISRLGGQLVFVPKKFSALLTRDIGTQGTVFFFAEQKKINQMAPQAKKKIRVRCKNLAFYSTESHTEPFFAEQKRENGAAGKKKIEVQSGWCSQKPSSPWYPVVQPWNFFFFFFFFFFFSDFCCAATELYTVAEPLMSFSPTEKKNFFFEHRPCQGEKKNFFFFQLKIVFAKKKCFAV